MQFPSKNWQDIKLLKELKTEKVNLEILERQLLVSASDGICSMVIYVPFKTKPEEIKPIALSNKFIEIVNSLTLIDKYLDLKFKSEDGKDTLIIGDTNNTVEYELIGSEQVEIADKFTQTELKETKFASITIAELKDLFSSTSWCRDNSDNSSLLYYLNLSIAKSSLVAKGFSQSKMAQSSYFLPTENSFKKSRSCNLIPKALKIIDKLPKDIEVELFLTARNRELILACDRFRLIIQLNTQTFNEATIESLISEYAPVTTNRLQLAEALKRQWIINNLVSIEIESEVLNITAISEEGSSLESLYAKSSLETGKTLNIDLDAEVLLRCLKELDPHENITLLVGTGQSVHKIAVVASIESFTSTEVTETAAKKSGKKVYLINEEIED